MQESTAQSFVENARILSHRRLTGDLWELVLVAPGIAKGVQPGQYVHLLLTDTSKHMLRRPLSIYQVLPDEHGALSCLVILYQVIGKGTAYLSSLKPAVELNLLGPVGKGWSIPCEARTVLLVGGGVGVAPLIMLTQKATASGSEVHALIGARNAAYFKALTGAFEGVTIHGATDDGSFGHHGLNVELLDGLFTAQHFDYIASCGPEPMQKAVAKHAHAQSILCEVSLERRMACALGACLSCAVETTVGKKLTCVDGPVFDAREVIW